MEASQGLLGNFMAVKNSPWWAVPNNAHSPTIHCFIPSAKFVTAEKRKYRPPSKPATAVRHYGQKNTAVSLFCRLRQSRITVKTHFAISQYCLTDAAKLSQSLLTLPPTDVINRLSGQRPRLVVRFARRLHEQRGYQGIAIHVSIYSSKSFDAKT